MFDLPGVQNTYQMQKILVEERCYSKLYATFPCQNEYGKTIKGAKRRKTAVYREVRRLNRLRPLNLERNLERHEIYKILEVVTKFFTIFQIQTDQIL